MAYPHAGMTNTTASLTRDQYRKMFYVDGPPQPSELMRNILTQYSHIPEDEIIPHIEKMRERAWAVHAYPCVGRYRFIAISLTEHRLWESHVLKTLTAPSPSSSSSDASSSSLPSPLYLELGVCFGQEMRALMYAGVPASRIYGADIEPAYFDLGYDLFQDRDRFPASHQIAPLDIFDKTQFQEGGRLADFRGRVDILHLTSVFHLFSLEKQVEAAKNVLVLLKPGGVILGCQTANTQPGEFERAQGKLMYRHNAESWEEMWTNKVTDGGTVKDAGAKVNGMKLKCNTHLRKIKEVDRPDGKEMKKEEIEGKAEIQKADHGEFRWMLYDVWVGEKDGE